MRTALSLTILFATLCAGPVAAQQDRPIPEAPFPLAQGSFWIYEGTVRWTPPGSSEVLETKVSWRMEILETIDRRSVVAARVKGHPMDLAWYEEAREPREYLIVQMWQERYYLLQGKRAAAALKRLRSDESQFIDLVTENELFLEFPLADLRTFGPTSQLTRDDQFYFWVVGRPQSEKLEGLPRVSKGSIRVWEVSQRTLGSFESFDFAEGVGFTRYRFRHNGTVSEFDVKLAEFGRTSQPSKLP